MYIWFISENIYLYIVNSGCNIFITTYFDYLYSIIRKRYWIIYYIVIIWYQSTSII